MCALTTSASLPLTTTRQGVSSSPQRQAGRAAYQERKEGQQTSTQRKPPPPALGVPHRGEGGAPAAGAQVPEQRAHEAADQHQELVQAQAVDAVPLALHGPHEHTKVHLADLRVGPAQRV